MERKPNLNNNEEGKIESEEYEPLPGLDYRFFEYMQEGVTVYSLVRDESGEVVDLVINYANIAAYRQRKSLKKGLIGKSIKELYGYEAVAFDLKKANEVVSTGRGTKYETYFAPVDKYFSVTAFSPKEDLYITLTTDITRRKKAEEEARIERQKLLDIIEFLPDATFVIDENKKVIAWNKALEEMTGTPKEEIIGKGNYAYSIPFYGERRPIIVDLIFLSEKEIEAKYSYVKREGNTLFAEVFVDKLFGGKGAYVFVKASPLYDGEGNLVGSIETIRDITEQKKVEEEMQIERQKLLDIIEFLPDATFVIDENKKVIAWNKALEEMTGTPKEEIMGKGDHAYSVPFYGYKRPILVDLIFSPEKEIESKYDFVKREGNTLFAEVFVDKLFGGKGAHVFVKASPLYDNEGNLVGSIETIRDITEQKKAEERTKRALEEIVEAYFELDNDWRFVEANEKVAEIIGKKREELIGNVIWDVIPEAKGGKAYKKYNKAKEENIPVHFETKSVSSGEWYEIHAYPSEEGLIVYAHNINELKKAICPPENEDKSKKHF